MLYYGIKGVAFSSAAVMKVSAVHLWEALANYFERDVLGGGSAKQPNLPDSRGLGCKQAPCPRLIHSYSATMQIKSAL